MVSVARVSASLREVAVVSTVHDPDDTRIYEREIGSLLRAGYVVHYFTRSVPRGAVPAGCIVHSLGVPRSRWSRMTTMQAKLLVAVLRTTQCRVVHAHDPELLPLLLVLRLCGRRVILDVHEDMAAQLSSKYWLPASTHRTLAWAARVVERHLPRIVNYVAVAEPAVAARMPGQARVRVVENFVDTSEVRPRVEPEGVSGRAPNIVYVGGVSEPRGLTQMIDAALLVHDRMPQATFEIIGPFQPASLESDASARCEGTNITLRGRLSRAEVWETLARSDIGLALLRSEPNYVQSQPTKVFEYLAAGLVVVASDFPAWRRLLNDSGAVVFADPTKPDDVADAIADLLGDPTAMATMAAAGRDAVMRQWSWESQALSLIQLYEEITGARIRA